MTSILSSSHEIGNTGYNALLLKQPLAHGAAAQISNSIIAAADHGAAESVLSYVKKSWFDTFLV